MRKYILIFLTSVFVLYFGLGYYVYSQAVATTCSVYEPETNNSPDSFSLGEKASWDPSKYFVSDYEKVEIKTEEAIKKSKSLSKELGIPIGISAAANVLASEWYEKNHLTHGKTVTVLCDRGERYLSN